MLHPFAIGIKVCGTDAKIGVKLFDLKHNYSGNTEEEKRQRRVTKKPVAFSLLCTECGQSRKSQIVGGQDASTGKWPWQVTILRNLQPYCGASIISDQWILSAAHCFYKCSPGYTYMALLGTHQLFNLSHGAVFARLKKIILHPDFNGKIASLGDIALIQLETPVDFTNSIMPIYLPTSSEKLSTKTNCWVTGWGEIKYKVPFLKPPLTLQEVKLSLINQKNCKRIYNNFKVIGLAKDAIKDDMICAGYPNSRKHSCQCDSGGPLTCLVQGRWTQVGIVSWRIGCASKIYPGVYTSVSYYSDWIKDVMEENMKNKSNSSNSKCFHSSGTSTHSKCFYSSGTHSKCIHSTSIHSKCFYSSGTHPKCIHSISTHSKCIHSSGTSTLSKCTQSTSTHSKCFHSSGIHSKCIHSTSTQSKCFHSSGTSTHSKCTHSTSTQSKCFHSSGTSTLSKCTQSINTHSKCFHSSGTSTHSKCIHSTSTQSKCFHSSGTSTLSKCTQSTNTHSKCFHSSGTSTHSKCIHSTSTQSKCFHSSGTSTLSKCTQSTSTHSKCIHSTSTQSKCFHSSGTSTHSKCIHSTSTQSKCFHSSGFDVNDQ
ncbi:PREDICTED: uncharacterized protein LOC106540319 [Thamnophis sirtalis]|uniref:Uncharacterized protein LOC106540319 n=1 Tax=Thamnophis sirtalis TaxID=35019 RepID=A0A6I9X971_9SAUR|nr:PREDICTED: uncharacterized protein LOC106540319 [Thamnophis sirtalis]